MRVSELVAEEDAPTRRTGEEIKTPKKTKGGENHSPPSSHAGKVANRYRGVCCG
jgi:hypothetical protein